LGKNNVYASVKAYSKRGKLLTKADFQTLAESRNLEELMTRIKNTVYADSVADVQKPYKKQISRYSSFYCKDIWKLWSLGCILYEIHHIKSKINP